MHVPYAYATVLNNILLASFVISLMVIYNKLIDWLTGPRGDGFKKLPFPFYKSESVHAIVIQLDG